MNAIEIVVIKKKKESMYVSQVTIEKHGNHTSIVVFDVSFHLFSFYL
jgi:hypothetical protein